MKHLYLIIIVCFVFRFYAGPQMMNPSLGTASLAQLQPFSSTVNTLNAAARGWSLNYAGGHGQRTVTPLGYHGVIRVSA